MLSRSPGRSVSAGGSARVRSSGAMVEATLMARRTSARCTTLLCSTSKSIFFRCERPLESYLGEERFLDVDVLHRTGLGPHSQLVAFEKLAEAITVDQVDGRRTIAGRFLLGVGSE
jgi:hypothetical protein